MGKVRLPHQHPKRLKPSLQQALYHVKQPILTLLAGSVIALAINFSIAQVHLTQSNPDDSSATISNPTILESFDIKTNPEAKEVNIILHRQASRQNNQSLEIRTAQKGNQFTVTLENTQLSQQMVDSGLPVVIDNQNKLIGRAVPGKTVNQSKIIIPNLSSQDDYQVLVYEQIPGKALHLLSGGEPRSIASASQQSKQQAPLKVIASNPASEAFIKSPTFQTTKKASPEAQTATETLKPGTEKAAVNRPKLQPRPAVSQSAINPAAFNTPTKTPSHKLAVAPAQKITPVIQTTAETIKPKTEKVAITPSKPQPRPAVSQSALNSSFLNTLAETPAQKPAAKATSKAPSVIHTAAETSPKPRTEKVAVNLPKLQPRSAVPTVESRFDSLTPSVNLQAAPLAALSQAQESFALASIAKNQPPSPSAIALKAKRPIQIVENKLIAEDNSAARPKSLPPLSTMAPETAVKPQTVTNGPITYIPPFSTKGLSHNGRPHGPLWNPYVIKDQAQGLQDTQSLTPQQNAPSNESIALSHIPSLPGTPNSTPSPDPLWYLHNLPSTGNNENVTLQSIPELNSNTPANPNPTLSPAAGATPAMASGSIQIDNRFLKSLKQTLLSLPIWFYIVFGLFFGGIGLFATLGAVFIVQQLWLNTKRPTIQTVPETKTAPKAAEPVKRQPEPRFNLEAVQFQDSINIELRHYLEQNRAQSQQQQVKNAVKKSVLLHFPSQRAGNKPKSGQASRKASHLLL